MVIGAGFEGEVFGVDGEVVCLDVDWGGTWGNGEGAHWHERVESRRRGVLSFDMDQEGEGRGWIGHHMISFFFLIQISLSH